VPVPCAPADLASATTVSPLPEMPLTRTERARFEAVYRQHHEDVLRLLHRRLDNPDDVAELAQEACLRILRYRHCEAESLRYLLIRTALNLAASHGSRASSRHAHVSLEDEALISDTPSPEDSLEETQRMQHTLHAVQDLPARCRQVFLLRLVHGLRQQEIARRCGVSTRMVEMHLARARGLIRERMAGNFRTRAAPLPVKP
jgi:RNA polymerase sigma factor (sigma-70 family)